MKLGIQLPEDVAQALERKWGDLSQYATEMLGVEGYRSGVITAEQLHRVLSLRTRREVEAFLEQHGIDTSSYTGQSPEKP